MRSDPRSTGHDGERLRRLSIKPLRIVDDTQDGVLGSQLGQQAKEGEAHEQPVGRRAGNMAERHPKSISLGRWQLFKGGQARHAELLGGGKRELLLGFVPDRAEHLEPCRRIHRVTQQGGLANSGLPVDHNRAAVTGTSAAFRTRSSIWHSFRRPSSTVGASVALDSAEYVVVRGHDALPVHSCEIRLKGMVVKADTSGRHVLRADGAVRTFQE